MNTGSSPGRFRFSDLENLPDGAPFEVLVLFTTVPETALALRRAAGLASQLNARIELIVPEIVPYPLPVDRPPVAPSFLTNRYRTMVQQAGIDADIRICLCREPRAALATTLKPGSLIMIGIRPRWWLTRETRLARWLEAQGHRVVVVDGLGCVRRPRLLLLNILR
jgi:hypothetical protein